MKQKRKLMKCKHLEIQARYCLNCHKILHSDFEDSLTEAILKRLPMKIHRLTTCNSNENDDEYTCGFNSAIDQMREEIKK